MKSDGKFWVYLWEEWIKPILIAVLLAFFIRTFVVQPFKIPSSSMYPALQPGDRIFVNKFLYGTRLPFTNIRLLKVRNPQAGDIIVFKSPIDMKKYLVKRFIAAEGETVEIKEGTLFINGKKIERNPFKHLFYYNRGEYDGSDSPLRVPKGYFYVLGDNSANSHDSRYWGFIPYKNLAGSAFLIHWPPKRIRFIPDFALERG